MRVATCNIRCYPAEDGPNHWELRKEFALSVIRDLRADIICFQELWLPQCDYARDILTDFAYFGIADETQTDRPTNAIFYREDKFSLVSPGGFWLSETPHVSGSRSWGSACVRLANWLRLRCRSTDREFRVVNTHLDHVSQKAREESAKLICEDAEVYGDEYPQILTGDMNCDFENYAISQYFSGGWRDSYSAVHGISEPGHTFHAFKGPEFEGNVGKMDWVFVRGCVNILAASIIDHNIEGNYPSDHYFVTADVEL
tara:strand:- start:37 stop:807 length:771 start_codon:yes stop_codon:yes gene_type:complete